MTTLKQEDGGSFEWPLSASGDAAPAAQESDAAMSGDALAGDAEAPLRARPEDHLVEPDAAPRLARTRFLALLALVLALHGLILALILLRPEPETQLAAVEEIPVEIVPEPEPEPPPSPPEPPKPPEPPPPTPEKQPKPKLQDDERMAVDAPRFENKETVERDAPDPETKARKEAAPSEQNAETPAPPQKPEAPPVAAEIAPEIEEQKQKLAEDKPDAEALDKAAPAPVRRPADLAKAPAQTKAPPTQAKRPSVADQLAALAPSPDYKIGSAAKPSPVGGGTARTSYLSILFGLIMPHMKIPADLRSGRMKAEGIVAFYVDERGNLTHSAVYRASGRPDLDRAAMAAVRAAAPFPPPPRGDPRAIWFHYDTQ
ncbi:TonB family protein [Methylocella sp.]|uniref:TonB family protein n=1 Tax=Methylocella sp. TaxID=1978226 RepID=UPI003783D70B